MKVLRIVECGGYNMFVLIEGEKVYCSELLFELDDNELLTGKVIDKNLKEKYLDDDKIYYEKNNNFNPNSDEEIEYSYLNSDEILLISLESDSFFEI